MNQNPSIGSNWKGRVLLYIKCQGSAFPETKKEIISKDIIDEAKSLNCYESKKYEIIAEIGQGICLPQNHKKTDYKIKIQIGDHSIISKPPKQKKYGYCRWSQRLQYQENQKDCIFEDLSKTVDELDTIFLYLLDSNDNQICFWRGKTKNYEFDYDKFIDEKENLRLTDPTLSDKEIYKQLDGKFGTQFNWYPLINNQAVGKIEFHESGMIQFKIHIRQVPQNQDTDQIHNKNILDFNWKNLECWRKPPAARLQSYKIRCYVYQCKDLPAADADGSSDPFVTAFCQSDPYKKTKCITNNQNPIFFEVIDIDQDILSLNENEAPPIILNVWDRDKDFTDVITFKNDDFLGRAVIDFQDAIQNTFVDNFQRFSIRNSFNNSQEFNKFNIDDSDVDLFQLIEKNIPPIPKWYDLKRTFDQQSKKCGQILCGFAAVPDEFKFDVEAKEFNFSNYVKKSEQRIEINILGLRQLQSMGLIPVQKAYIRINAKSILPPDKENSLTNIDTEPKMPGSSPNINTTIKITTEMPESSLFSPVLSCEVFDNVCKGLIQPKIGSFSIFIGDIMKEQQQNKVKILKTADSIIQYFDQNAWIDVKYLKWENADQVIQDEYIEKLLNEYQIKYKNISKSKLKNKIYSLSDQKKKKHQLMDQSENFINEKNIDVDFQIFKTNNQESVQNIQEMFPDFDTDKDQSNRLFQNQNQFMIQKNEDEQIEEDSDQNLSDSEPLLDQEESLKSSILFKLANDLKQKMNQSLKKIRQKAHEMIGDQFEDSQSSCLVDQSFTSQTLSIKQKLIEYAQQSLVEIDPLQKLDHHQLHRYESRLLNYYKASIFAEDTKIRNQSFINFQNLISEIKMKRDVYENRYPADEKIKEINRNMLRMENEFKNYYHQSKSKIQIVNQYQNKLISQLQEPINEFKNQYQCIIMPKYQLNTRLHVYVEDDHPDEKTYTAVGFDSQAEISKIGENKQMKVIKHYRKKLPHEFEKLEGFKLNNPYITVEIKRGQSVGSNEGLFSIFSVQEDTFSNTEKIVGHFKGQVQIFNFQQNNEFMDLKREKFNQIQKFIRDKHKEMEQANANQENKKEDFDLNLDMINSLEQKYKLKKFLKEIKIDNKFAQIISDYFFEMCYTDMIQKSISQKSDKVVRLYVLDGENFSSKDFNGLCDPYLVIKCGEIVINQRDKCQYDEPNPQFNECFEFNQCFPGSSPLIIEAWDYDLLFGDDFIGSTLIEIDDRILSPEWVMYDYKPVENRTFYHPSSMESQGSINCWVDIFSFSEFEKDINKKWNVQAEPKQEYEIRLSIFDLQNVPCIDGEFSDVFVRAWMGNNSKNSKETDTHWRCQNGEPSFNYRMLLNFESPHRIQDEDDAYFLHIEVYDRDLLQAPKIICRYKLDIFHLVRDSKLTLTKRQLSKQYFDPFFKQNYGYHTEEKVVKEKKGYQKIANLFNQDKKRKKSQRKEIESNIIFDAETDEQFFLKTNPCITDKALQKQFDQEEVKIRLDLQVLPKSESLKCKVGEMRSEPNNSPYLPPPEGRMTLSLNPFKMIQQLFGKSVSKFAMKFLCLIICVTLGFILIPEIFGDLISEAIQSLISKSEGALSYGVGQLDNAIQSKI